MPQIIQTFRKGNRAVSSLLTGLIEWWALSEGSGDRVGSYAGITFTSINGVGNAAGVNGTTAAAFVSASLQELDTSSSSSLQMGDIDFSIAGWVYMTSSTYGAILNKWQGVDLEYILYFDPTISSFRFILNNASGTVDNVPSTTFGSAPLNTWYFVYAEYDATADLMKIGVNAGPLDSHAHTGGTALTTAPLVIGRVDAGNFQDGRVQRCGLWKRKLTTAEVSSLYNGGLGKSYPFLH